MSDDKKIIDGTKIARQYRKKTAALVQQVQGRHGVTPCLATILVGSDPASEAYVNSKVRLCAKVGMTSVKEHMPESTTTAELLAKINQLANDPAVHGILLQHPVPEQIDERACFEAIPGSKDVDGVTMHSFGTMSFALPGFASCTPGGMVALLDAYDLPIEGKHAVVVGRSAILGKPLAMMLLARNATVTICHSRTKNLPDIIREADIVCAALGRPNFVKGDWLKEGAVVLDAGYNPGPVGDAEFETCYPKASMITPVPGGVGPMTLAMLTYQTAVGAARQLGDDI